MIWFTQLVSGVERALPLVMLLAALVWWALLMWLLFVFAKRW